MAKYKKQLQTRRWGKPKENMKNQKQKKTKTKKRNVVNILKKKVL